MFSGGECGMVIRWDDICNEIGIQIPDDDNIRWVHTSKVTDCGNGALLVSEPTGCPFCGEQVTLAVRQFGGNTCNGLENANFAMSARRCTPCSTSLE